MNLEQPPGRIARAIRRRSLLLAILIYVGLDLSLPAMPGAFVFEPEYSIDTVDNFQTNRARPVVLHPLLVSRLPVRSELRIDVDDQPAPASEFKVGFRVVTRLPRAATLDPAPSPEDSH